MITWHFIKLVLGLRIRLGGLFIRSAETVCTTCYNINPYPANVGNMVAPTNSSKWRMGFNSAFKGLRMPG